MFLFAKLDIFQMKRSRNFVPQHQEAELTIYFIEIKLQMNTRYHCESQFRLTKSLTLHSPSPVCIEILFLSQKMNLSGWILRYVNDLDLSQQEIWNFFGGKFEIWKCCVNEWSGNNSWWTELMTITLHFSWALKDKLPPLHLTPGLGSMQPWVG